MVQTLRHESSYEAGTWIHEELGVYVGWVARNNSFSAGMPLFNERRSVSLVFSGEEYSDPEIIRKLRERGHKFETDGPAYLPHLYEEEQTFPAVLNGRFQGLLVDQERGAVTLFNDRYGLHRLYYHESSEAFYFAAEAKAILAVRPELRSISAKSLGEWISCGCVLQDRALFEGVRVLPAGSAWKFEGGALRQKAA
jgi:asparagine synthase (glutamine-hydrolysing)